MRTPERIIVAYDELYMEDRGGVRCYDLLKYHKSNQNSCFGQKPTCMPGQRVKKGDVLADGPGIDEGELALGKNLTVAFMPWCGYNYEDSVLISEKMVKEDIYTSVHIEEFEVVAPRYEARAGRNHPRYSQRGRGHAAQS